MLIRLISFLLLLSVTVSAEMGQRPCSVDDEDLVELTICLDDEVKELDTLRLRIQNNVFARIEFKYLKKEPDRAKVLRNKFENSVILWDRYRASYCEMESISVPQDDDRAEFVKACIISITKGRIEDLRLMQLSI